MADVKVSAEPQAGTLALTSKVHIANNIATVPVDSGETMAALKGLFAATSAETKTRYEANADTNVFDDAAVAALAKAVADILIVNSGLMSIARTTHTGNTAASLDNIVTLGRPVNAIQIVLFGDELQIWKLKATILATDVANGIVAPADQAGTTNEKHWYQSL